jgi:hypothetical protein
MVLQAMLEHALHPLNKKEQNTLIYFFTPEKIYAAALN